MASNSVSAWQGLLATFAPIFTAPSFAVFSRLMTGWVLATGRRTIASIFPFADPQRERSVHSLYSFLRRASWDLKDLWRTWALILIPELLRKSLKLLFTLDDTLLHKSGLHINGVAWWRDAVRSTGKKVVHALGLNVVILCVKVPLPWGGEPLSLPINMRIHRKGDKTPIQLADDMIQEFHEWFPDLLMDLVADGAYAALVTHDIPSMTLTSRLRRDAAIFAMPPTKRGPGCSRGPMPSKGRRLLTPAKLALTIRKWTRAVVNERGKLRDRLLYSRRVIWNGTKILLVIVRDPKGRQPDDFFFTKDLSASAAEVASKYADRWTIEDTNKWVKQALGIEEPQVQAREAPEKACAIGLILYGLVWLWFLNTGVESFDLERDKRYPTQGKASFWDALGKLREALWREELAGKYQELSELGGVLNAMIRALANAA